LACCSFLRLLTGQRSAGLQESSEYRYRDQESDVLPMSVNWPISEIRSGRSYVCFWEMLP
jgi:hypothetical protein